MSSAGLVLSDASGVVEGAGESASLDGNIKEALAGCSDNRFFRLAIALRGNCAADVGGEYHGSCR